MLWKPLLLEFLTQQQDPVAGEICICSSLSLSLQSDPGLAQVSLRLAWHLSHEACGLRGVYSQQNIEKSHWNI